MTDARPRLLALSLAALLVLAGCSASQPQRATTTVDGTGGVAETTSTAQEQTAETTVGQDAPETQATARTRTISKTRTTTRATERESEENAASAQSSATSIESNATKTPAGERTASEQSGQANSANAQPTPENTSVARNGNVSVVSRTDTDGDGYATAFALQIRANTTLVATDLGNEDGDPYFEVAVGDTELANTGQVEPRGDGTFAVELDASQLSEVERGTQTITVTLRDRDLLLDDEIARWTVEIDLEPPAERESSSETTKSA